jgi:hypothetical protein
MRNRIGAAGGGLVLLIALFGAPLAAFADGILHAQMNAPPSNNILDNIYVGPYSFTNLDNSGAFRMICDDFKDETNYNPATYMVRSFDPNNLVGTVWGSLPNAAALYQQAGWLAMGLMNQTGLLQGEYHYALWAVFDATDVISWLKGFNNGASICNDIFGANNNCNSTNVTGGLLLQAQQNYGSVNYSNMLIVTPPCTGLKCSEQEFLMFSAPDGGSALEYLGLAAAACLVTAFYSRRRSAFEKAH